MTGNRRVDTILVLLSTLAALAMGGTVVYTQMVYKRPIPDNATELSQMKQEAAVQQYPESWKLDKLTLNLKSETRRLRFLDVELYLHPFPGIPIETFDQNKAMISDRINDIAGAMTPDELNSVAGKILLENRIRSSLNSSFGKKAIKRVLFSRFVVQ